MLTTCGCRKSRLAQLVERKTLNLVVVGSSPTVGGPLLWRSWQRVGLIILRSRVRSSPGAVRFYFYFYKKIKILQNSPTGIRTRVVWVKTTYPDQLDYWGEG